MIATFTIILFSLVALNFVLLKFSCNKCSKKIESPKPSVIKKQPKVAAASQLQPSQLAPTGS